MTDIAMRATEVSDGACTGIEDSSRHAAHRVPGNRHRRVDGALLLTLVAIGLVERLPQVAIGYWGDEVTCIGIAAHPLSQIPHYLRLDAAPPLYYVLLHGWMRLFGENPVATHSLSLLIALACIPAAWWMGDACFGRAAARGAAALTAGLPYLTTYSTETRMYALLGLLSILAVGCFARLAQGGGRGWSVGAAVASAAVMYTHDWGLYLVGAEVLVGLGLAGRRRDPRLFRRVMILAAAASVLYLPWLPSFWFQLGHTGAPWSTAPSPADLVLGPLDAAGQGASLLLLSALLVAAVPLCYVGKVAVSGRHRSVRPATILCLGMVALAWAGAQLVRSWDLRYLGVAVVPLTVVIGARLVQSRVGRIVVTLVTAGLLVTSMPIGRSAGAELVSKSNAATLLPPLSARLNPGDLVIAEDQGLIPLTSYYLHRPGLRFAGPFGTVKRPAVWDGTDPVRRLDRSDPQAEVTVLTDELPAGSHVLFVGYPSSTTSPSTESSYNRRFHLIELWMAQAVSSSPRLRLVRQVSPRAGLVTGVPMIADLYVVS